MDEEGVLQAPRKSKWQAGGKSLRKKQGRKEKGRERGDKS